MTVSNAFLKVVSSNSNSQPTDSAAKSSTAENYHLIESANSEFDRPGVWFVRENDKGDTTKFFISSPLKILAETQTETGENYGRLLEWKDSKDRVHSYAMPIEQIHGESNDLIRYLASHGLQIGTTRRHYEHLRTYINLASTEKTVLSTDKIGWNGTSFVLPDEVFGSNQEIIYQSEASGFHKFNVKGTAAEWREKIGKFCAGNSRLVFAVSVAFACPLLPIAEITGGGFHFRGLTSSGKTTALLVAGSVCGGSDEMHGYCQTWKSTANGLEVVAESHNNMLLCLDEIGECEPREVGNIAYMLSNGQGKNRMSRNTSRKKSYSWHLLFLSSGERKLSDIIQESGQTVRGGQEIRLCDIDADSGKHGIFEQLHNFKDGRELSDYFREASRQFYGSPIREFLRKVTAVDRTEIKTSWRKFHDSFINEIVPSDSRHGEVLRVASRFVLIAFAGEYATLFGLTGWEKDASQYAAADIFKVWLEGRKGRGGSDAENMLSQVRNFLDTHGQSRFQWLGLTDDPQSEKTIGHAGYKRKNDAKEIEYLIFPDTFRNEVCKGFDSTLAARILNDRNCLDVGNDGKLSKLVKIGTKPRRFYVINSNLFDDENDLS